MTKFFSGLWFYITNFRTIQKKKKEAKIQNKIYEAQAGRILESKMFDESKIYHDEQPSDIGIDW